MRGAGHLWENGRNGLEELVLWSGYPIHNGVLLSSLLLPTTQASWGWVGIGSAEQLEISKWLVGHGQLLFVETHTHGTGRYATEMSGEDRRHPVSRQDGFLTMIVTDYGRRGIDFRHVGVWEYRESMWAKLSVVEKTRRLIRISDKEARHALS